MRLTVWRPGDTAPPLGSDAVHLWLARWAACCASPCLGPDESARAARLLRPVDRARFVAARTMLRHVLGAYRASDPSRVQFRIGAHGKPFLADGPAFNLSHGGDWVAVVVGRVAVGVDIEPLRGDVDHDALARQCFSPAERDAWRAAGPAMRVHGFAQLWARKEAYLKMRGTGLIDKLGTVGIAADDARHWQVTAPGGRHRLFGVTFSPDARHAGAVAADAATLGLSAFAPDLDAGRRALS